MAHIKGRHGRQVGAALVLDGHSRAAVETLQSLGRNGIAVDVASEQECIAFKSRYCRRRIIQPDSGRPEEFGEWLETVAGENQYRLIVPSTEASLRCLARILESHPVRRNAVLPSNKALATALDKRLTWELARSLGIPVPASRLVTTREDIAEPEGFPLVLKPVASTVTFGGRIVRLAPSIVRTREERARALDRLLPLCPVLEQEYVTGRGVGIECLYRNGSCVWHFQHERLHELPLTGGGSSYRRSSPADAGLLSHAKRLLDGLEWHGVAMVEFKGTAERGFRLMEVNPRLWGSLALAIDAGVDFPHGLWNIAVGVEPGPQPDYRWPYYSRNLELDLYWIKENLRADHSDSLLLTRPRLRSLLEYGRPLLGRESWDHFDARDWRVWGRTLHGAFAAGWRTAGGALTRFGRPYLDRRRHRRLLARVGRDGEGAVRRVLFVCHGNICRSPLAESHARKLMPELEVASSGFHETAGRAPPDWFQAMAGELGVDLSTYRSKRIDRAQVEWAQLILLADIENLERFKREFPEAAGKATLLGLFLPTPRGSIEDPYSLGDAGARSVAREVLAAVEGFVTWSCARRNQPSCMRMESSNNL